MDNERIAKIESTFLGREDHGIFTAMLQVSYGSSGQGIGNYALDRPVGDGDAPRRRVGTDYGMEWIIRAMDAAGVSRWEDMAGRTILVYLDSDDFNAQPIGFGPLPTERGKPFMFSALNEDLGVNAA